MRVGDVVAALPAEDGFGRPLPAREAEAVAPPAPLEPPERAERLVAELQERRRALAAREEALTAREQLLEAMAARLEARLEEMETVQQRLEETAVLVDDAAGRDIRHLSRMYEQMKPKNAAQIFDQMPASFAAGFLGTMDPERAALVMANMTAENAYAVSLLLAGRNVGRGERPMLGPAGTPPSVGSGPPR